MNRLARPVSQLRTQVRHSHVFDGETLSVWKKVIFDFVGSFFMLPLDLLLSPPTMLVGHLDQPGRPPSFPRSPPSHEPGESLIEKYVINGHLGPMEQHAGCQDALRPVRQEVGLLR